LGEDGLQEIVGVASCKQALLEGVIMFLTNGVIGAVNSDSLAFGRYK
jgi:hypothetical protein